MTNDLGVFFKEVYQEFTRITWPTRKEFFINLAGTFFLVFLFSVYFGLTDTLISLCLTKIILFVL